MIRISTNFLTEAMILGIFCLVGAMPGLARHSLITPNTSTVTTVATPTAYSLINSQHENQNPQTWFASFFESIPSANIRESQSIQTQNGTIHRFKVYVGNIRVLNTSMILLKSKLRLIWMSAETPEDQMIAIERWPQFEPPNSDNSSLSHYANCKCTFEKVYIPNSLSLRPAWRIKQKTENGKDEITVIDAISSEVYEQYQTSFQLHQANIYGLKKPRSLKKQILEDLGDSNQLSNKFFSIQFAPEQSSIKGDGNKDFLFHEDGADATAFEQVQAYHSTNIVRKWFETQLGYKNNKTLKVSVHDARLPKNNAAYLPESHEILIAPGDGSKAFHLASDVDVIAHEFGHHVIYDYIDAQKGESGALHEGLADYFTYAMTSGTDLAKKAFLGHAIRSAILDDSQRVDLPELSSTAHAKGEILAAALWEIRKSLGTSVDQLVFRALNLVHANAGYREFILAMFATDLDANPEALTKQDQGIYGRNKCLIMNTFVKRGYATFMEDLDGESCDLNLNALAAESRAIQNPSTPERTGVSTPSQFLGRPCGVFPVASKTRSLPLILFIFAPLFICLLRQRFLPHL